jgi:hypothetical protein
MLGKIKKIVTVMGITIIASACSSTDKKIEVKKDVFCEINKVTKAYDFYRHHVIVYKNKKKIQDIEVAANHGESTEINAIQKLGYTGRIAKSSTETSSVLVDYNVDIGLAFDLTITGDIIPVMKINGLISKLHGFTSTTKEGVQFKTPNVSEVNFEQSSGLNTKISSDSHPAFYFEHKDISENEGSDDIYEFHIETCPYNS